MNLGELDIVWKQKESNFQTLPGRCCWLILYNLLYWLYKRPGSRLKAGQLHQAGCTCLLLREKMRLLLVWSSELTWATLSWLQRELCFILPTVCWTKWSSIQQWVQSRVRIHPKPAQASPRGSFPSSVLCHHTAPKCSQECIWVAFCPFFSPSINIANAPVINATERDLLKDVNIHQSLMICIWIQKIGLWLLTAFLSLWFSHALNTGGLNTWGSLWSKADFAVFIWKQVLD